MEYKIQRSDDSLMHYGVLGMKWGVRKSDYTPSGTRRKKLLKTIKKNKKYNNVEKTRQILSKEISKENIKKVKEINKKMSDYYKDKKIPEFESIFDDYDSKEHKQMILEAQNKILKNINKYVPDSEEVKKWAKEHNISIWETKPFDRALSYEIYDGPTGKKYKKIWNDNHKNIVLENKKLNAGWEKIYNEKQKYYDDIVNNIVGDYGSTKIGNYSWDPTFKSVVNDEVRKILDQY